MKTSERKPIEDKDKKGKTEIEEQEECQILLFSTKLVTLIVSVSYTQNRMR